MKLSFGKEFFAMRRLIQAIRHKVTSFVKTSSDSWQMGFAARLATLGRYSEAMEIYNSILSSNDPEKDAYLWMQTLVNRANCLWQIPYGNIAEQFGEARASLDTALPYYESLGDWHMVGTILHVKALAFQRDVFLPKDARYNQAMECYQKARQLISPNKYPVVWAKVTNAYGSALQETGNDLGAIDLYQEARSVLLGSKLRSRVWSENLINAGLQTYIHTLQNLGNAYTKLSDLDAESALDYLNRAIKTFEEALASLNRQKMPVEWAAIVTGLAMARIRLFHFDGAGEPQTIVDDLKQASLALSPRTNPIEYIRTKELLGNILSIMCRWEQAVEAYQSAIDAANSGFSTALSRESRLALTQRMSYSCERGAYAALHTKNGAEVGFKILESGKARVLANALLQEDPGISLDGFLSAIPNQGSVVAPLFTPYGSAIWVIPHGEQCIKDTHILWLENISWQDFTSLFGYDSLEFNWFDSYEQYRNDYNKKFVFMKTLEHVQNNLWEVFIGTVVKRLHELNVEQVIFISSTGLPLLPLHASQGPKSVLSDHFRISYVPSASTLVALRKRSIVFDGMAYVAGATDFIAEAEVVAQILGRNVKLDKRSSRTTVFESVSDAGIVHISSHGSFAWGNNPLTSGIVLESREELTVADVATNLRLKPGALVVLSACETGVTDFLSFKEEHVGLSAAFIEAGAGAVVSTLWPVDAVCTAIFMMLFYSNLRAGDTVGYAFHRSQYRIRNLTSTEIINMLKNAPVNEEPSLYKLFSLMDYATYDYPFRHPYYWAAYMLSAVDNRKFTAEERNTMSRLAE